MSTAQYNSYRKILKISPSMYKPPKTVTQKNPLLNRPPTCRQIQSKTKQKW